MKVFGIGLNKTGTKTLGHCLKALGYNHKSFDYSLLRQVKERNFDLLIKEVNLHDSFEDWPYPLCISRLDEEFSGSKFILTYRSSPEIWINSLEAHSLTTDPEKGMISRILAYGYPFPHCDRDYFIKFYLNHINQVRVYFQHRSEDYIEICWENGDGYDKICRFLGKPIPSLAVPHLNKSTYVQNQNYNSNLSILRALNYI
jgi:hypothetical protein